MAHLRYFVAVDLGAFLGRRIILRDLFHGQVQRDMVLLLPLPIRSPKFMALILVDVDNDGVVVSSMVLRSKRITICLDRVGSIVNGVY